jgi:hypothetical protein
MSPFCYKNCSPSPSPPCQGNKNGLGWLMIVTVNINQTYGPHGGPHMSPSFPARSWAPWTPRSFILPWTRPGPWCPSSAQLPLGGGPPAGGVAKLPSWHVARRCQEGFCTVFAVFFFNEGFMVVSCCLVFSSLRLRFSIFLRILDFWPLVIKRG